MNSKTVKGAYGSVFTLDKDTGLVTFDMSSSKLTHLAKALTKLWTEALQWLPVQDLEVVSQDGEPDNSLILTLTTGEVVRLTDDTKDLTIDNALYKSIGHWIDAMN